MSGSIFGNNFTITTWGESHGPGIGVVIDGVPAGLPLTEQEMADFLSRRKPGTGTYTTSRKEDDLPVFLSGIYEGVTTGTPLSVMIQNTSQISKDYAELESVFRPSHADYTFYKKYGIRDPRGGGRSSGRETAGRVAAGAVAVKILSLMGIELLTFTRSIGSISISNQSNIDKEAIFSSPLFMPDKVAEQEANQYLDTCRKELDSSGGVIECRVKHLPAGIGEPVFSKLDAVIAQAVMSIGAVKAVEIGDGISVSEKKGSQNNDCFTSDDFNRIIKKTNHSGGILGGISDGSDLIIRASVKPTPSIAKEQDTVTVDGEKTTISIHGRHDPIIVPRAVVVVESMVAISVLDLMMQNMNARLSSILSFYDQQN